MMIMINLLIALPMSSQLPCAVTPNISGIAKQSPKSRTAENIFEFGARIRIKHPTIIRGKTIFKIIRIAIVNGEKTVMKCRVQEGSKELMLAILPVPKKQRSVYNI
jgi:hypothetical protein